MLTVSPNPPGWHRGIHTERISPKPTVPAGGKESPRCYSVPPVLWVAFGEPPIWFHPMETAGESAGLDHWESVYDREREGACNNQQLDSGRLYLKHPS